MIKFPMGRMQFICVLFFSFSLCLTGLDVAHAKNSIIINEILFNPNGPDSGKEWIELVNPCNETKNVSGWTISNETGIAITSLPNWDVPGKAYLVVCFGNGTNDDNFADGSGYYYTNFSEEIFNNSEDACGLFNNTPSNSSMVDFILWSCCGPRLKVEAYSYALNAGVWNASDYFDINWTKNVVLDGESIGRDKNSTDNDSVADWSSHGGKDAYFATPGWPNGGPLFSVNDSIFFTQAQANSILIHYGFNITYSNHSIIQKYETDNDLFVNASHHFVTSYDNNTVLFSGFGVFHWDRINLSYSMTKISLNLFSNYGELVAMNYSSEEKRSDNNSKNITQKVVAVYSVQKNNNSYQSKTYTHIGLLNASCNQKYIVQLIKDNSIIKTKNLTEIDMIHSFNHTESWVDGSESQNIGNNTSFSMHSNTYINPDDINEFESIFDKYLLKEEIGTDYSLAENGYFRSNRIASNLYCSSWRFSLGNNSGYLINISGFGYHEYTNSSKGLDMLGNVTYDLDGVERKTKQYYIDGELWKSYDRPTFMSKATAVSLGLEAAGETLSATFMLAAGESASLATIGGVAAGVVLPVLVVDQGYQLFFTLKDHIPPTILVERTVDKWGELCFRLHAYTGVSYAGIVNEEELLKGDCIENGKCTDEPFSRAYTATDVLGNSRTIYVTGRVDGISCDDKNPCTTDYCVQGSGECHHEAKCKETCYQSRESMSDCICEVPINCDAGECSYEKKVKSCNDEDICTADVCNDGQCSHIRNDDCPEEEKEWCKAKEICGDGIDNNGDLMVDEGCNFGLYVEDNSCKDDIVGVEVDGKKLGETPIGGGQYFDISDLKSGDHTLSIIGYYSGDEDYYCGENNIVTYGVELTGGLKFLIKNSMDFAGVRDSGGVPPSGIVSYMIRVPYGKKP
ncbi:MAG: lamin tail domain-containing protein [Methanothrix sp.]|nr:lamin tail domain-containing protein [Methanothrix sp.]